MTYIIAEIGSNWRNEQDCHDSIREAKACGADCAKFQLFTVLELYGPIKGINIELRDDNGQLAGACPYLNPDWLPRLKATADKAGIDFMCSAFSPEGVDIVDPFVKAHKIASSELTYPALLKRVAEKGKPVFLSTAIASQEEIDMAKDLLKPCPITLMYCVGAYPARCTDFRRYASIWSKNKDCRVGFSDHSIEVFSTALLRHEKMLADEMPVAVEKHFILDRNWDTPDAGHSLVPYEFGLFVKDWRQEELPEERTWYPEEQAMVLWHRRRIVAIKDIKPCDTLQNGVNIGVYRSLKDDTVGANGLLIDRYEGLVSKKAYAARDGVFEK